MPPPPIRVKVSYVGRLQKGTKLLGKRILIGIPAATAGRAGRGPTNAELGYIHEFSMPPQNIPARPFLLPGVRNALPRIEPLLRRAALAAVDGDVVRVTRLQHQIGLIAQAAVKNKIRTGPFAPLAARTIAGRIAKGRRPPFKPLIDTAQMLNAVTYVIR